MNTTKDTALVEYPLVIDLDGTLIKTDLFWESIILLLKNKPHYLFFLPLWLLRGKAILKKKLLNFVMPDVKSLPYNKAIIKLVDLERKKNRQVILATASHTRIAEAIAQHTGLFTDVIGSTDTNNIKGKDKLIEIEKKYGNDFDYAGNSFADFPIWNKAKKSIVAVNNDVYFSKMSKLNLLFHNLVAYSSPHTFLKLLRSVQWLKNLIIFIPLLTSMQFFNMHLVLNSFLAFFALCLCASGTYLLNDLLDIEADRAHKTKKHRPFASGDFPIIAGIVLMPVLLLAAFLISVTYVNTHYCIALGIYTISTLAYSFFLKRKKIADVLLLAALYTIRVYMGGIATDIAISDWLLSFILFFFLSLALVKRSTEIYSIKAEKQSDILGRGYFSIDDTVVLCSGISSAYLSVLIFILYIKDHAAVSESFAHPIFLWFVPPILLYWITKIWFLTVRGKVDADPVLFSAKDPVSWVVGLCITSFFLIAAL